MFANNSYSNKLIIGSYIRKSGLFFKRFKFVQYFEKVVYKKVVQNMRAAIKADAGETELRRNLLSSSTKYLVKIDIIKSRCY